MRMFVKYDESGNILSICKVEVFPEILEIPFGPFPAGEFATEIEITSKSEKLEYDEIHEDYKIDNKTKKLMRKWITIIMFFNYIFCNKIYVWQKIVYINAVYILY